MFLTNSILSLLPVGTLAKAKFLIGNLNRRAAFIVTKSKRITESMFKMLFFFIGVTCLAKSYSQAALPKDLNEAILYFQQYWTKSELDTFKNKSEAEAGIELHHSVGTWIRNTWVRGNRDTALTNYFRSLGISVPDDISSIILISLHRKLNNKNIDLDKQIKKYQAYWKPILACKKKLKERAVLNYKIFKVGEKISIYMPVENESGSRNAVMYNCPNITWTFNPKKDLLIKGNITKKYFLNDTSNVFFSVKISSLNRKDTQILMTQVSVGDTKDFSLMSLKIE